MNLWIKLLLVGAISGSSLGLCLKIIEYVTGKKVYTLLLNVDYLPVLKDIQMSETAEFLLHIFVSILLVVALFLWINTILIHREFTTCVLACTLLGMNLYITTAFSERTPEIFDAEAFIYWVSAHLLYGVVVGLLLSRIQKVDERRMDGI